jgi:hypothetical protein
VVIKFAGGGEVVPFFSGARVGQILAQGDGIGLQADGSLRRDILIIRRGLRAGCDNGRKQEDRTQWEYGCFSHGLIPLNKIFAAHIREHQHK